MSSRKYLITALIGVIVLFLIGGSVCYFINKHKQASVLSQQKSMVAEEISGANGLKAEVRIKEYQYSVVLIENGEEKNVDYCFENPAGSTRERNSEVGPDCSSFAKLEFSPKGNYLIYIMANSTAPVQKFLYNIKTGKREAVDGVIFSDDEKYFSSCVANDEGSIYSEVIYDGESFDQIYSVPSEYASSVDCRKTTYNKENNTFIFTFNSDVNRGIEYNLDTRKSSEFNRNDPKNQINKIKILTHLNADDSVKYFCFSNKNNYMLVCQEKDKCIKINNADELSSNLSFNDFRLSFHHKDMSDSDRIFFTEFYDSLDGGYDGEVYAHNTIFYYFGWEDGFMSGTNVSGSINNLETGFEMMSYKRMSTYCDGQTDEEIKNCSQKIMVEIAKLKKEYSEKYRKLLKSLELVNNFNCDS